MTHLADFTDNELKLLETWKTLVENGEREDLDKKASVLLKIAEVTVRTRKSRMKSKYEAVLAHARHHKSWQQYFFQKTGGKFNPLSRSGRGRK
jgi:hypothetical protein